jgi:hypothetical protein
VIWVAYCRLGANGNRVHGSRRFVDRLAKCTLRGPQSPSSGGRFISSTANYWCRRLWLPLIGRRSALQGSGHCRDLGCHPSGCMVLIQNLKYVRAQNWHDQMSVAVDGIRKKLLYGPRRSMILPFFPRSSGAWKEKWRMTGPKRRTPNHWILRSREPIEAITAVDATTSGPELIGPRRGRPSRCF